MPGACVTAPSFLVGFLVGFLIGFFAGLLEKLQQFAVHGVVAGDDLALGENGVVAVEIGDEAAGFAHQDNARGHVPRRQVALPISIEPSGRDPGEIESGGAVTAQAGEMLLRGGDFLAPEREIAAAVMRQPAGDDGLGEPLPSGDADALVVEESALAAFGDEQVVVGGIVDEAGDDRAVALERDRHREMRNAVQKIGRAVERIDDPAMGFVGAFVRAAFLAEEAVIGPRLGELFAHDLLGALVGGGDEIARPLQRNLQLLDLAEIALEAAPGAMRRLDHDVEDGGVKHVGWIAAFRLVLCEVPCVRGFACRASRARPFA